MKIPVPSSTSISTEGTSHALLKSKKHNHHRSKSITRSAYTRGRCHSTQSLDLKHAFEKTEIKMRIDKGQFFLIYYLNLKQFIIQFIPFYIFRFSHDLERPIPFPASASASSRSKKHIIIIIIGQNQDLDLHIQEREVTNSNISAATEGRLS